MSLNHDPSQPTRLENWVPVDMGHRRMFLSGDVYNHPRRLINRDGQDCMTTCLVAYDPEQKIARTKSGTKYVLGNPHSTGKERFWKILADLKLSKKV